MIKKSLFKVVIAGLLLCSPSLQAAEFEEERGASFAKDLALSAYAGIASAVITYGVADACRVNHRAGSLAAGLTGIGASALVYFIRMHYKQHLERSLIKENQKNLEKLVSKLSNPSLGIRQYKDFEDLKQWLESPTANLGKNFLIRGKRHFQDLLNKTDKSLQVLARFREGIDVAAHQRLKEFLQKRKEDLLVILELIPQGDPELYEQQRKQEQELEEYMRQRCLKREKQERKERARRAQEDMPKRIKELTSELEQLASEVRKLRRKGSYSMPDLGGLLT